MGRGGKADTITEMEIVTWMSPDEPAPDGEFQARFGVHGEFFNDRLVIPLRCPRGQLLGWDSRVVGQKEASRYMLPGTGHNVVFLGMPRMMPRVWSRRPVWIVEGFFDLLALEQCYPQEPILGTGPARLVYSQLQFLRRFASEVNMVFDRDKTGRQGTERALKALRELEVECRDIPYRGGKDPGEIWDKSGLEGLRTAFPKAA